MRKTHVLVNFTLCLLIATAVNADDWPQWLGPNRDSAWHETGIVDRIPDDGLTVNWRVPVQWGYGGPAVADGKVYLMDYVHQSGEVTNSPGGRDELTGTERVLCFDADTGDLVWKHEYDRPYSLSYPRGPRCTPTVADGKVYALGAMGNLTCLDAASGDPVWSKDLPQQYNVQVPIWGFSSHPLVHDDLLICQVGGEGHTVVALDKISGEEKWKSLSAKGPGYCSPNIVQVDGVERLAVWHASAVNLLDPNTGKPVWSKDLEPGFGVATAVPKRVGDRLFVTGAGRVSAMLDAATGAFIWRGSPKTSVSCGISTPVVDDGIIYGNDAEGGSLVAAKAEDGERLWETVSPIDKDNTRGRGHRNATLFMVKNGDKYFMFNDSGELVLANLSPDGYQEVGRFQVLAPTSNAGPRNVVWSHPAYAQKCIFARNDEELVCVSLAAE